MSIKKQIFDLLIKTKSINETYLKYNLHKLLNSSVYVENKLLINHLLNNKELLFKLFNNISLLRSLHITNLIVIYYQNFKLFKHIIKNNPTIFNNFYYYNRCTNTSIIIFIKNKYYKAVKLYFKYNHARVLILQNVKKIWQENTCNKYLFRLILSMNDKKLLKIAIKNYKSFPIIIKGKDIKDYPKMIKIIVKSKYRKFYNRKKEMNKFKIYHGGLFYLNNINTKYYDLNLNKLIMIYY